MMLLEFEAGATLGGMYDPLQRAVRVPLSVRQPRGQHSEHGRVAPQLAAAHHVERLLRARDSDVEQVGPRSRPTGYFTGNEAQSQLSSQIVRLTRSPIAMWL